MTIQHFPDLIQGSDEWLAARLGILTASEVHKILTPTLKIADNDKTRAHVYELLAQRITQYVEPTYIGDAMIRGHEDEVWARMAYSEHVAPVHDMGFVTNDQWGFKLGYSPDGMVGADGLIECKSRRQGLQVKTIVENVAVDQGETIPAEHLLQLQTGLLVTERQWIDYISYSGGLPMVVIRVWPNPKVQAAIIEAAQDFEERIAEKLAQYRAAETIETVRLIPTERRIIQEIYA